LWYSSHTNSEAIVLVDSDAEGSVAREIEINRHHAGVCSHHTKGLRFRGGVAIIHDVGIGIGTSHDGYHIAYPQDHRYKENMGGVGLLKRPGVRHHHDHANNKNKNDHLPNAPLSPVL
jgi:hypothetical protein